MDQALSSIVESLKAQGARVRCKGPSYNGVTGLCIADVSIGGIPLRVLIVGVKSATPHTVKAVLEEKVDEDAHIAVLVAREPVDETVAELLAGIAGLVVVPESLIRGEAREEAPVYVIPHVVNRSDAEKVFRGRILSSLKGFLGVFSQKKIEFVAASEAYLRLRCYKLTIHVIDEVPEALEAAEASLCFETASGSLVEFDEEEGLRVSDVLVRLGELEDETIEVIQLLAKNRTASIAEIAEHVGSFEKARVIVEILAEFGLVEFTSDEAVRISLPTLAEYRASMDRLLSLARRSEKPSCEDVLGLEEVADKLDRIVGAFGSIEEVADIYYPLYVGVFKKYKDSKSIDVAIILDGVSGERMEDLEELIASSPAVFKLDDIINRINRGAVHPREECRGLGSGSTASQPPHGSASG